MDICLPSIYYFSATQVTKISSKGLYLQISILNLLFNKYLGGGGGKGTWGKLGDEIEPHLALDNHDPNYDSEEQVFLCLMAITFLQIYIYFCMDLQVPVGKHFGSSITF